MPRTEGLRADAARNRTALLRAVEELLTHHHPAQISMDLVATTAGVGKGTVFHRFGSRDGLMLALIQERARDLGVAITDGPPPLGPGAPARARLLAFLSAIVDLVSRNKGLLAALGATIATPAGQGLRQQQAAGQSPREEHPAGQNPPEKQAAGQGLRDDHPAGHSPPDDHAAAQGPREEHPVYRAWHGHIAGLAAQERPDLDADMLAHVLLASVHSEPVLAVLARGEGDRLDRTLRDLVTALIPDDGDR